MFNSDKIKSYGCDSECAIEIMEIENKLKNIKNKEEMDNIEIDSINERINKMIRKLIK